MTEVSTQDDKLIKVIHHKSVLEGFHKGSSSLVVSIICDLQSFIGFCKVVEGLVMVFSGTSLSRL